MIFISVARATQISLTCSPWEALLNTSFWLLHDARVMMSRGCSLEWRYPFPAKLTLASPALVVHSRILALLLLDFAPVILRI
jgi:hypothetical protein